MFLYNLCVIIDGGSAVLMYIFNQVVHDDDSDDDEYSDNSDCLNYKW